jgi:WD40 repeat protein
VSAASDETEQGSQPTTPSQRLPTFVPGTQVGHHRIVRLVGRGGMGEVYLARDTLLGRRVALKVIHPARIGAPHAVQLFLTEARTTARFAHPNIVTVYGVGEHHGAPHIAMEYLEGKSLRARLREGQLPAAEALRVGMAVADALEEAHRNGTLHRDLKPENVLLARDGRPRVVDFGLARTLREAAASGPPSEREPGAEAAGAPVEQPSQTFTQGTPAYMAPELWLGTKASEASDVWALGVVLYEMLGGHRPFRTGSGSSAPLEELGSMPRPKPSELPGCPTAVAQVLDRCLGMTPPQRPTAAEVASVLRQTVLGRAARPDELEQPFRGLLPFAEEQAGVFFGREAEIALFLERLSTEPTLAVLGPSGAGKSSFVTAGVVPRLRERGPWRVLSIRPGRRPLHALASRLVAEMSTMQTTPPGARATVGYAERVASEGAQALEAGVPERAGVADFAARLAQAPSLLHGWLADVAEEASTRILLFVDQAEELYTLADDVRERDAFLRAVCTAAQDEQDPVRVVLTLREDFLGRVAEAPEVREALSRVFVMRSPGREALEEILRRPAEAAGYAYEDPALVGEMVASVQGEPACLPTLQFAARMLWDQHDTARKLLLRSSYEQFGGVAGALAEHADGVLAGLDGAQLRAARQLLLRLVSPAATRRVLSRSQLLDQLPDSASQIADRLVEARLVVARVGRSGEPSDEVELELVHESLVTGWATLARWLEESHADRLFLAQIEQAAELWDKRGRPVEEVWRGEALAEARRGLARSSDKPRALVAGFLETGVRRELASGRRRRALVALAGLALVAVALVLFVQKRAAQRREGESPREGARAAMLQGGVLEARAKLRASFETVDSPLSRGLWWRLARDPLLWGQRIGGGVYDVAFSADGRTVAAASHDKSLVLLEAATSAPRVVRGFDDQVGAVAFAPSAGLLAAATRSGKVHLMNADGLEGRVVATAPAAIRDLAFDRAAKLLATAGFDGTVLVIDVATPAQPRSLQAHAGVVSSVAFGLDPRTLVSAGFDGAVRVWDLDASRAARELRGHEGFVLAVAVAPSVGRVASGGQDQTIRVWDLGTGEPRFTLAPGAKAVTSLAFGPDGKRLASGHDDQSVRVWDAETGAERRVFAGHTDRVRSVAFSPDGRVLVSAAWDRTVRAWNLALPEEPRPEPGHAGEVNVALFSPDDRSVASAGYHDSVIRLWDVATGTTRRVLAGHAGAVQGMDFSSDGSVLVSSSYDKTIRVWGLASPALDRVITGHEDRLLGVAFGPDGKSLVSWGYEKTARVWDVPAWTVRAKLEGHTDGIGNAAFSPNGKLVATAGLDRTVRVWDAATGAAVRTLHGHTNDVFGIAFSPDGALLASGGADGTVRTWDAQVGEQRAVASHGVRIYTASFHPDGSRVGLSNSDGVGRIWNHRTGEVQALVGHAGEVLSLRFSHDGRRAATSGADGTVRLWDTASGRPIWRAPALLLSPPRLLSHRGWIDPTTGSPVDPGAPAAWRTALETTARQASEGPAGLLCVATENGSVQLWSMRSDKMIAELAGQPAGRVHAIPGGCAVLAQGAVRTLREGAGARDLVGAEATALGGAGDEILVAASGQARAFDPSGAIRASFPLDRAVTALGRAGELVVLGYPDGSLELVPVDRSRARPSFAFEDVPSSPVVAIAQGPGGLVVAGHGNGRLGLWSPENGALVYSVQLHGPVQHLIVSGTMLFAATSLGAHTALELSALTAPYCAVLREVWARTPVAWDNGMAVPRARPGGHRCALQGSSP